MTKRAAGWICALGLLLAVSLGGVKLARGVRREIHRFHRPILAEARESVPEAPQAVDPRTPDFLQPQRLDAWRIIGPGGGGAFYNPAISPHDPNLVFASTDMTACYVSENGGRTWRTFNLRWTCKFVFDPKLPSRVYALSAGLFRSDDRGHTWNMVYPDAAYKFGYVDDEAEPFLHGPGGYPQGVYTLAVDPDDSNTLYASMEERLQVSRDAGKNWKVLAQDALAQQLWIDPTSPREKRTIYTRRGAIIGTWDGAVYVKRTVPGIDDCSGAAFGIPAGGGKPVIYVATNYKFNSDLSYRTGGVMASNDGGQTWRSLNDGILKLPVKGTAPAITTIATSLKHPEAIYFSFDGFRPVNDPNVYYGIMKSPDGGASWALVRSESSVTAPNSRNDWVASRFGPDWANQPLSLAVDDNNPNIVYGSDLGRIMRSLDGGKNWAGVYSQSTGTGYTTTGLDVTTCYGIHFDPFDPKRVFISYTDIGLMRSEDGGESWLSATAGPGVPKSWRGNTYWVEFDPAVKGRMWAVMSSHHDIPRMRELNRYGGGSGGVAESVDGGHTWTATSRGLTPSTVPTHIILDPKSPVAARVLYIAAFGRGVYKSTDGGQTWAPKSNGLPANAPLTWRMALGGDGTLYVVTIRRSQDGKYGNDNDGWVFRSRDGAESWERVPMPPGLNGPVGITVDPRDPQRLYVAAWARYTLYNQGEVPPDGGVFLSADGGQHWQNVLNAGHRIYDVTVDPRNSDLVYAVGFEASAWRSTDRGKTWSRIGGFNFKDGHRAIPDPTDIGKIYITTFGNSVWHGPAAGDPKATEDIAGPPSMLFQSAGK